MCLESFDSDSFNDGFCHSTSRFDECLSVDSVSECRRYIIISRKCSTICMEVVGMKKALFKIIIPLCVLVLWMITCYPVCNKADGFDYFLYWILVGCPYGIRNSCAEEFWNCRKYGNTGTELYRWRSDWWYYCFCEDYRYIYADNKSNSRTLLDTMSKGVKEKRATKKALSINHKQYIYLSSGTYSIISSIRQSSI